MSNILLFCGAREVSENYTTPAYEFGEMIAKNGHVLVYGGGTFGIMGAVYRGAASENGKVIGVIPRFLMNKERGDMLQRSSVELIQTETMDERKKILFDRSDIVIMLPGGIGTLDEFFEAMTLVQLKQRNHKLIILNTNGYYDTLLVFLEKMVQEGFYEKQNREKITVVSSPIEALSFLES